MIRMFGKMRILVESGLLSGWIQQKDEQIEPALLSIIRKRGAHGRKQCAKMESIRTVLGKVGERYAG